MVQFKYNNISIQAKASFWYAVCNFIQKGISFFVIPIYVRLLSPAEYGEWSVFQSWAGILIIFASLNLYCGVFTKQMVALTNSKKRDEYTSSMQGLGTLTSLFLFLFYLLFHNRSNQILGIDTELVLLLFLYFIVYPAFSFWGTRLRVEYKYKPMVFASLAIAILTPVVSLILLNYTHLRANALILGYLIVQCSFGLFFYVIHFYRGKCLYKKEYWSYALKFNIPLIPHYLSIIVLGQSDRIMIKHYCGEGDAGIYSFAYQIAASISVLVSAINGSRVPWTYEQLKNKSYGGLKKVTNALVGMMAILVFAISLISPEIIKLLGTSEYLAAVYVVPIVLLGVYFTFVYDLFASIEFYYGATKYVMCASVLGAILNIVLNAIFIPVYGFMAAAFTTLICYIIFMVMHYLFSTNVLKQQKIESGVYNNAIIFLISTLGVFSSLFAMAFYSNLTLRLSVCIGLIGLCFVKRNYIKKLILTIKK